MLGYTVSVFDCAPLCMKASLGYLLTGFQVVVTGNVHQGAAVLHAPTPVFDLSWKDVQVILSTYCTPEEEQNLDSSPGAR